MESQKKDNNIRDILIGLILFALVFLLWYFSWQYIDANIISNSEKLTDNEVKGLFGDKFGAINALFSAFAFAGIIFTIFLQKRELKLQREELEETRGEFVKQNETLKVQRFENTFFKMIDLHNEIIDKMHFIELKKWSDLAEYQEKEVKYERKNVLIHLSTKMMKSVITNIKKETKVYAKERKHKEELIQEKYKEELKHKEYVKEFSIEMGNIQDAFLREISSEKMLYSIVNSFDRFIKKHVNYLSHYYRNAYHIFKYIHVNKLIENSEKQFYASLFRAQLSQEELLLIYVNSLAQEYGNPNFMYLINRFDLMQNLNRSGSYSQEIEIIDGLFENLINNLEDPISRGNSIPVQLRGNESIRSHIR